MVVTTTIIVIIILLFNQVALRTSTSPRCYSMKQCQKIMLTSQVWEDFPKDHWQHLIRFNYVIDEIKWNNIRLNLLFSLDIELLATPPGFERGVEYKNPNGDWLLANQSTAEVISVNDLLGVNFDLGNSKEVAYLLVLMAIMILIVI